MKKTLEQALLDEILYVGNEIPESLAEDKRSKFILLGTPRELIDAVEGEKGKKVKTEREETKE